jgi:thioredoxin-related protein
MSIAIVGLALVFTSAGWRTDFTKAKLDAKKDNKLILLKFSGSDWCLPCIRMEKEIFAQDSFGKFAEAHLEMVNADFPRLKKNKLDNATERQNESLAEQYDKDGHFPFTVLLNADGKVLKTWDGYKGEKPQDLIQQISSYAGSN